MSTAAVAVPLSAIHSELGGVLPPSALVQNSPRHGRSRGVSFRGKNGRGRGYSVVEERDVSIAKALMFVLKRTITESEADAEDEVDNLVADAEGWVGVDSVVRPRYFPRYKEKQKLTGVARASQDQGARGRPRRCAARRCQRDQGPL